MPDPPRVGVPAMVTDKCEFCLHGWCCIHTECQQSSDCGLHIFSTKQPNAVRHNSPLCALKHQLIAIALPAGARSYASGALAVCLLQTRGASRRGNRNAEKIEYDVGRHTQEQGCSPVRPWPSTPRVSMWGLCGPASVQTPWHKHAC